jgi:hypothetical protein
MPDEHGEIADAGHNSTARDEVNEKHEVVANNSSSDTSRDEKRRFPRLRENDRARTFWRVVSWTPKSCRWDPESPPKFSMSLNLLFGFGELLSRWHCT